LDSIMTKNKTARDNLILKMRIYLSKSLILQGLIL